MIYHSLFLLKIRKDIAKWSSAAVVIGALRVKLFTVFLSDLTNRHPHLDVFMTLEHSQSESARQLDPDQD